MATKLPPPPRLPNWTGRTPGAELSRPPAEKINAAENRNQTLTFSGFNQPIPIVYGEQIVSGPLIAGPVVSGGNVLYAIALCWGGTQGIEQIMDARVGDVTTAIAAIATPATGRQVGSSWWVYDGRQTAVNPWLAAAIPGFSDVFSGVAYVVGQFSATSVTSWPQPTFLVRGRKCRDPRNNVVAWTENPVLHMLDFVENADFGMGVQMRGAAAAADVCDSLYSGLPRSRSGLCIQDAAAEGDILPLLAGYAEVLWGYDGADIVVVPDAPVSTIHDVPVTDIRADSIQLSTVNLAQIPTLVQITFTDRNSPEGWVSRPARAEAPAHTLHGGYTSASTVALPGLFNRVEAERRAWQRLQRLLVPGRINWQMMAPGMVYEAGDVVRLPDVRGLRSVDVRLTAQPEMIAPSLWQMGGEIYRSDQYPDDDGGTVVPVGAILILRGTAPIPTGWEAYSAGNRRLLREGAPGNAGALSSISRTYTGLPAGGHLGQKVVAPTFNVYPSGMYPDLAGPVLYVSRPASSARPTADHSHTFQFLISAISTVPRRNVRAIRKTGSPSLLPPGVAFFSASQINETGIVESRGLYGGYLALDASESASSASTSFSVQSSLQPSHTHPFDTGYVRDTPGVAQATCTMGIPAGGHYHTATASVSAQLSAIALSVYESVADPLLPAGAIVGWESNAIPTGWALCDGQNGTVDLRDRFIYLSANAGDEISSSSSIRIQVGASTADGAHSHGHSRTSRAPTFSGTTNSYAPYHNNTDGGHSHAIGVDETVSLDAIVRHQLRFIQYVGA